MQTLTRPVTAEQLELLSAQGEHYELINGELREMSPTGARHGRLSFRLPFYVTEYIYNHDLGEVFAAETGFLVSTNPDTVLAPDFAFVAHSRLPDPVPDGYIPVIPDLVLETRSPSDRPKAVAEKVGQWLALGVRLVWEMNPATQIVTVYTPGAEPQEVAAGGTLGGGDVLPGFALPLSRVFG